MSENEFIREVNDEYRRDRLAQIWSRYSGVFIGLAVLVVLGVGGWRYWQHAQAQQSEAASLRFEEALRRAKDGTPEDAEKAFAGVVADAPFGYRLLARLRAAAEAGKADPAAGAKAYSRGNFSVTAMDRAAAPGNRRNFQSITFPSTT